MCIQCSRWNMHSKLTFPPPCSRTHDDDPDALTRRSTPFGQQTESTVSAAKVVEEVVHGVKAAVDGAISWAEKKAGELRSHSDSAGPYTSPATRAPSELDAIATGVLPAMAIIEQDDDRDRQDKDDMANGRGPDMPGDKFSRQ
ncbi:hypothetical protein FB567DRAFT_517788 [Paraphoma chrysanthemicola]|uniref:Uncharacterized protein n=1 Tax=Paraphoma chrysanthemicola TaxID=798071 RepID=A0A8K0REF5_9PLEO|nr:hypothetical protein FB567DRAFT_517788 [Paraphoma chrysanthemicola]